MNMSAAATGAVALTLLAGSPAITFIGAVGAAVAVMLPRGGLLVSILILPLTVPVLIFGVSAAYGARRPARTFCRPSSFSARSPCSSRSSDRLRPPPRLRAASD